MTSRSLWALLAAAAVAVACHETLFYPPPPAPVASITIAPALDSVLPGAAVAYTAVLRDSAGDTLHGRPVTWSTVDTTVASVDSTGAASALTLGTARIVAAAGDLADTATLVVLPVQFVAVQAGLFHTCALTNTHAALCWGYNYYGQDGIGHYSLAEPDPIAVVGGLSFATITLGDDHTCAVTPAGAAYCWGLNSYGQLGHPPSQNQPNVPVAVRGGLTFSELTAAAAHSCGLVDSIAYCWGLNIEGELGDSNTATRDSAAPVVGAHRFRQIAAGGLHTCAIDIAGVVWCWGSNASGELGDSSAAASSRFPVRLTGTLDFLAVAAGADHSCGVASDGTAYCWGKNDAGQLGAGVADSLRRAPTAVMGGLLFSVITAGVKHTCGLSQDSTAYCWGDDAHGQLGDSANGQQAVPVAVTGGLHFVALSAGGNHTCGLSDSLAVYCWGMGSEGELGNDATSDSNVPVRVTGQVAAQVPRRSLNGTGRSSRTRTFTPFNRPARNRAPSK